MKIYVLISALTLVGSGICWSPPANALGCVSGGLAGAVAGHMAHHGVLGAVGGCIAGHEYNKHQRRAAAQDQGGDTYQPRVDRNMQQRGAGQDE